MAQACRLGNFSFRLGYVGAIAVWAAAVVLAALVMVGFTRPAAALPSFARQTGQPCGKCHTDFPALTPFGRRFKLGGYTLGGGQFQTTPFQSSDDSADKLRSYAKGMDSGKESGPSNGWVPPVSMMAIGGFTHTQSPLPPPTAPYQPNDNLVLSPFSAFWGGAITDNIGAFAQVTYNAPPAGGFPDPFGHTWTWDNTDVRFANHTTIGAVDVTYGITANNNPTVQDVWNTTPAWSFPYAASTIASTPGSHTLIDGTFAAHVASVGAYAFINDMVYLEGSAYRTLDFHGQNSLGTDPFASPGLFEGVAPYWRLAFEPHWGDNWLEIGTFGMAANVHPWIDSSGLGTTGTLSQTDKFTDVGFDTQYQYQGENFWLSLRASYIHEFQQLDATFPIGGSTNPTDELNTLRLQGSLAYGGDNRVVLTGQYFNTWGTSDPLLYAGLASMVSPNSDGFVAEIAYLPFMNSAAPGWPWFNARIALDYIIYDKFDGTKVGASGNNTLFLHVWLAM